MKTVHRDRALVASTLALFQVMVLPPASPAMVKFWTQENRRWEHCVKRCVPENRDPVMMLHDDTETCGCRVYKTETLRENGKTYLCVVSSTHSDCTEVIDFETTK